MEVSSSADAETVMGDITQTSVVYSCYAVTGMTVRLIKLVTLCSLVTSTSVTLSVTRSSLNQGRKFGTWGQIQRKPPLVVKAAG